MVVDAVQDPAIWGYCSDSRCGWVRRHRYLERNSGPVELESDSVFSAGASFDCSLFETFILFLALMHCEVAGHFVVATDSKGDTELDALPFRTHGARYGKRSSRLIGSVANRANALVSVPETLR